MNRSFHLSFIDLGIVIPLLFEVQAIRVLEDAFTVSFAVYEVSIVLGVVFEEQGTSSVHHIILELAYIPLSFEKVELSISFFSIVNPGVKRVYQSPL